MLDRMLQSSGRNEEDEGGARAAQDLLRRCRLLSPQTEMTNRTSFVPAPSRLQKYRNLACNKKNRSVDNAPVPTKMLASRLGACLCPLSRYIAISTRMSQDTCTDCLPTAERVSSTPQPAAAPTTSSLALDPILDPTTFSPPNVQQNEFPRIEIEFCDRCRSS